MEWIGFAIAAIAIGITFWTWGRFRGAMSVLEDQHTTSVKAIEHEHQSRVKRLSREAEHTQEEKAVSLVKDLSATLDALDEALRLDPEQEGVAAIRSQFLHTLTLHGIERVEPSRGDRFSPTFHEAIESRVSDVPKGCVAETFRAGLKMGEKSIRSALVAVSSGEEE